MSDAPSRITETYDRLKKEYPFYISLKRINGKYYVYKQLSRFDKETGKTKVTSTYLGRIAEDGAFIRKSASEEDLVENAKAIILANGGKVIMPEKIETVNALTPTPDEIDKKILMILSMNARASLSFISKQIGLTPAAVYNRVKQLEKIYNIKYTIELDLSKFGYLEFSVFAKFLGEKPTVEEIRRATESVPNVHMVAMLNGKYDLLIFMLAKSSEDISTVVNLVRDSEYLINYTIEWNISYFSGVYNFIPLRGEFIDLLKGVLKEREYYLLKEFNENSSEAFAEIDKKYGLEKGRADYAYIGLKQSGVLKRTTISMQRNLVQYVGIICISITHAKEFVKSKKSFLLHIMDEGEGLINKYVLSGDIGISKGVALFVPVFTDGDLEKAKEQLLALNLGADINTLVVTKLVLGSFCLRRFDNDYSGQYNSLVRDYHLPERTRTNYEGTKPNKRIRVHKDIRGLVIENDDDD